MSAGLTHECALPAPNPEALAITPSPVAPIKAIWAHPQEAKQPVYVSNSILHRRARNAPSPLASQIHRSLRRASMSVLDAMGLVEDDSSPLCFE